jgi:hypothetical protein
MYNSNYKSIFRCHTLVECVNYSLKPPVEKADLFLFLLDTYDILLSHAEGSMVVDENDDLPYLRLATKLEKFAFQAWDSLFDRIPGQLKGWCEGMFVYVCISLCKWLASKPGCTVIPEDTRMWMKRQKLRSHVSYDTAKYSISELLNALDIFELQWVHIESLTQHVLVYLDALEFRAAWFVTHAAGASVFDIRKHRIKIEDNQFQIHPALVYQLYVRFVAIRRSFAQYTMWDTIPPVAEMPETQWLHFVERENRHLKIRKFRDRTADITWENLLRLSDGPIASYNARGSRVSAYQAVAENHPLAILDKLNQLVAYGKTHELHADNYVREGLHLQMVHAYFMSTYSVSFKDFFYCSSEKSWKHRTKIPHMVVPVVIERKSRYDVMYRGLVNLVPNVTFAEAFQLWCLLVRKDYKGILYGSMDFGRLCRDMLDPPQQQKERPVSQGMTSYKWDV